jgi:hypothetical protein
MLIASLATFCAGVSAAIAVKLASSIDDVLWLSTFLTPHVSKTARIHNAMTYTGVCLLQTCFAYILSQFGQSVVDDLLGGSDSERMSTDRLLTLISGSALFFYSIVLGIDYYQENFGDNGELYKNVDVDVSIDSTDSFEDIEGNNEVAHDPPSISRALEIAEPKSSNGVGVLEIESCPEHENDQEDDDVAAPPSYTKKSRSLAIIAFLGSLDDLALFVPMLVGKTFGILELIVGAMFATFMIVIMCVFLTRCRIVADLLEKIPLAAIVFTFSVILLFKGIVFMS